jgi:hypothetical protein
MKLVSRAVLPVVDGDFQQAFAGFVAILRDHSAFDAQTRCSVNLIATRWKFAALVARALPADAGEFEAFPPDRRKMTAAEFLARTATNAKSDKFSCSATLTDSLSRDQTLALLSELGAAIPVSGRGVDILLWVDSAILSDASLMVRGRLSFGRTSRRKTRCGSFVFGEFEADSKSGPAAKKTLQELRDAMGFEWRKPVVMPDPERADRPSASELIVIGQCVREAFARAAADLDRAQVALPGGPHLYISEMDATFQRMRDITDGTGAHEKIDFVPAMRQFMRANFPDYASCGLGGSVPSFRKRLADHLDGLLFVERDRGFGKCFTLQYHLDFPGTRFGRAINEFDPSGSLFLLFHKGWMPPSWAYATSEDLAQTFDGCRDVLQTVLPALEARLKQLLSPVPKALPQDIETRGRLSAREAYEQALGIATAWAADAGFIGAHSGGGVDLDGRLQSHGSWMVRFESRQLFSDLLIEVPHSGQIVWNAMVKLHPLTCPLAPQGWLDSPGAMRIGIEGIRRLAPDHEWASWECGIGEQGLFANVWKIRASFRPGQHRRGFRDAYVYLNPVDGTVIHTAVYER